MVRLRLIRRLLHRAVQIGKERRTLLAEAAVCLVVARLELLFLSFPRLARRFGTLVPPSDPRALEAGIGASSNQIRVAEEVGWAVNRAARYVPFMALCLPQAMAAHRMLRRRGVPSVMHFGAAAGLTKSLDAHVWLDAAGVKVTGYPVEECLAEIARFV
jgi:hypothetical protein